MAPTRSCMEKTRAVAKPKAYLKIIGSESVTLKSTALFRLIYNIQPFSVIGQLEVNQKPRNLRNNLILI